jgi:hypothetical protein
MLSHERAEAIAKWLTGWGFEPILIGPIYLLLILFVFLGVDIGAVSAFFTALAAMSPVWLPVFLLRYFWIMWMYYIRYQFWFNQKMVLLEITVPPEVVKSPQAMETVISTMWNAGGETTFIDRFWKGSFRPVWSLEIASNEGRVSFYVHMRQAWRNIFESRLYGQYPEAKVVEAEDYVSKVPFNLEEYNIWGSEYDKAGPGALPLRTYYDYELEKNPDTPETKVDPIGHVLEFFSSIGKDEYLWFQIIMKARKGGKTPDEWYGFAKGGDQFKDPAQKAVKEVYANASKRAKEVQVEFADVPEETQAARAGILTERERERVAAIENSISKLIFECGFRGIYLAKKEKFNGINIGGLVRMLDTYRSGDLNQLNPARGMSVFNYPWQDFMDIRKDRIKRQLYFHHKNRAYFYVPYDQTPVYMNVEELASLWHFPSSVVQPPGLERVAAKRATAPTGLPTGS